MSNINWYVKLSNSQKELVQAGTPNDKDSGAHRRLKEAFFIFECRKMPSNRVRKKKDLKRLIEMSHLETAKW